MLRVKAMMPVNHGTVPLLQGVPGRLEALMLPVLQCALHNISAEDSKADLPAPSLWEGGTSSPAILDMSLARN